MSVSGLVITLHEDDALAAGAWALLAETPGVTVGPRERRRCAVVLETPSLAEDEAAFEHLRDLPGVLHVDLVCVYDVEALDGVMADDPCAATAPPELLSWALGPMGGEAPLVTLGAGARQAAAAAPAQSHAGSDAGSREGIALQGTTALLERGAAHEGR